MNNRDTPSRLRAALNPLRTTSLGGFHGPNATPLSAVSMASHNLVTASPTPVSAIQPYNPQQWAPSPAPQDRGHPQQPQQSPLPPPPYSPPRSQRPVSGAYESSPANISVARAPPPPSQQRATSDMAAVPSVNSFFAPPPGSRGNSRERRFGLPSFGRRRDLDSHQQMTMSPSDGHATQHIPPPPPPQSRSPQPPLHPGAIVSPTAVNAAAAHRHTVLQPLQIPSNMVQVGVPPGSRRAASTGAISTPPTSARSRSSSQVRWEMGMPLPPPPPGPPPSSSRTQSLNRAPAESDPVVSPPTRRPPPAGVTVLGPVPPTPAGWFDKDAQASQRRAATEDHLQAENSQAESSSAASSRDVSDSTVSTISGNSSMSPRGAGSLARTGAVRGEKTLRERRNESRTRAGARSSLDEPSSSNQLSNIVIPATGSIGSSMRRPASKTTPRSGGLSGQLDSSPRTGDTLTGADTATPPFSPLPQKFRLQPSSAEAATSSGEARGGENLVPHALPTPPLQSRSASSSKTRQPPETLATAPISPRPVTKETAVRQSAEQFSQGTIERFHVFAHKEAAAGSDAERVKLFAEFMVSESVIRRERYAAAIGAMGSEIFDLTRDLFRPMANRRESLASMGSAGASAVEFTPQSSEPSRSHRGSMTSVFHDGPSSAPVSAPAAFQTSDRAPASAGADSNHSSGSSSAVPMSPTGPPLGWQQSNYMPSLSPILSLSVSEHIDDGSSRGRTASRWWESSSYAGDGSLRLERSRRESKYMGVPKEAREALQWTDAPEPRSGSSMAAEGRLAVDGGVGSSTNAGYRSSSEYPPEKGAAAASQATCSSATASPNSPTNAALQFDVSRLVTLPPPYPRHHPAVNNSHPELTAIRTDVRNLSNMAEVDAAKERFVRESKAASDEAAASAQKQKQAMRANLQAEIAAGRMSYAEAASIEADSAEADKTRVKALEKAEFDQFQNTVVTPINGLLTTRIERATELFNELRSRLFVETRESNPNMPQEEGDEQPELLEKLTLLKWIFEAREALHRANYDLLTDRNDRYRDMVLTPYRLSGNTEKLAGAEAFFAGDATARAQAFAQEVWQRTVEFQQVVEANVVRGVEAQLSAFWDIAPPLAELLEQIPQEDLGRFHIRIPADEFEETPSYREHPLQYLFSLLLHAEKSTHQFIESQTNLLCLLHEVKGAVVAAQARVDGAETLAEDERMRLTEDLQDKVRVVQDQWKSGLGDGIVRVKERVGGWLLETGGWDESLEDGGVGSV